MEKKKTILHLENLIGAFPFLERIPFNKRGDALLALGLWQHDHHPGTKLEAIIVARAKPKPEKPPAPEIPVHTDMESEELEKFMRKKPSHQERMK